jgi:hypothetical protein
MTSQAEVNLPTEEYHSHRLSVLIPGKAMSLPSVFTTETPLSTHVHLVQEQILIQHDRLYMLFKIKLDTNMSCYPFEVLLISHGEMMNSSPISYKTLMTRIQYTHQIAQMALSMNMLDIENWWMKTMSLYILIRPIDSRSTLQIHLIHLKSYLIDASLVASLMFRPYNNTLKGKRLSHPL